MDQKKRLSNDQLRQRLRFGDPAWGDELSTNEIVRIRERLVPPLAIRDFPSARRFWRPVAAVATIAIGILIAAYYLNPKSTRDPGATRVNRNGPASFQLSPLDPLSPIGSEESLQQVQMTAPGGTRIVWVLRSRSLH